MTRLAVVSDIHADVHALRDALSQAARLGCEKIVCAGDLVDYGLFPEETLTLLRERHIPCVRGNHDRWAVSGHVDRSGWDLSPESVRFLEGLPTHLSLVIDGVKIAVWHARPRMRSASTDNACDMEGIYPGKLILDAKARLLSAAKADVLVVGHTHVAMAVSFGQSLIVNPGALLREPAPGADIRATGTFGVLNARARVWTVHRAADGVVVPHAT